MIYEARKRYHERLVSKEILTLDASGVASNADRSNASSRRIAKNLAELVGAGFGKKVEGQTLGTEFERITAEFLAESFALLHHIRPASWHILRENENGVYMPISAFEQYAHLEELDQRLREFPKLKAILGTGDIDCVYHAFLYELKQAIEMSVADGKDDDALDLLNTMIDGKRIKDISDLPLDLAV